MDFMLEMLKGIQAVRNPFFDQLFVGITILGEEYFAIGVVCLILWCVNKKAGYRIGFAYISSWILNFSVKEIFHIPRPFALDKDIIPLRPETATGYSFPSGHTQSTASLSTAVMEGFRKKWLYIIGILLIILMAGSRMYLGVHTLLDVGCGALLGIAWIFAANMIFDYAQRTSRKAALLMIFIPMIVAMVFIQTNDYYKIAGTFTGLLLGYHLDSAYIRYEAKGPAWQRIINYLIGMGVMLAFKSLSKEVLGVSLLVDYFRYFIIGIWITVIAPMLFHKMWTKSGQQLSKGEYKAGTHM
ncbi:MAG: phosphatase PAP2 family protein [Peptococcaceae bacterium]|nr:phosphatase PAP2 family protein [Peptococcaceae bacterium]